MNDHNPDLPVVEPARGDAPAERSCLRCRSVFWSDGFGERICKRCKAQAAWKTAIPTGAGSSHRASAR